MNDASRLWPLLAFLGGYVVLQLMLNIAAGFVIQRSRIRAITAVKAAFLSTIVNALYFLAAAVLLHAFRWVPNTPPKTNYGWLALAGLPYGLAVWYITTLGRKLGIELFGRADLIPAEDAALHVAARPGTPLSERYLGWGVVNLTTLQPLGRELFLRGALLPAVALQFGWLWAIAAALLIELLLRLNVVWLFQTLAYSLLMCGMFILTGSALTGLVAAGLSGLIHGLALIHIAGRRRSTG